VNADAHGLSELNLSEPYEAAEGGDVRASAELAAHQPAPQTLGDDVFEVDGLELPVRFIGHRFTMYLAYASRSRAIGNLALMIRTTSSSRSVQSTNTTPRAMDPSAMTRSSSTEFAS
jgi:hypothetical protein